MLQLHGNPTTGSTILQRVFEGKVIIIIIIIFTIIIIIIIIIVRDLIATPGI